MNAHSKRILDRPCPPKENSLLPAAADEVTLILHSVFDALAVLAAALTWFLLPANGLDLGARKPWTLHPLYFALASMGATLGAYGVGTLNLWLTGVAGLGRSVEGALAGGILAIELVKVSLGVRSSTGVRIVAPFAAAIVIGRVGCFLAGLDDMTYGTPTDLPWGVDFGDGVRRHPVQLYESATMAVFLASFVALLLRRHFLAIDIGFYLFVGVYAGQRFLWEFLKPYGPVIGPLNTFHLLSLALIAYALVFARWSMQRSWSTQSASAASKA